MNTRFVYLTDTHLGAQHGRGYVQQPRYADRLPELLALLDAWICRQDDPGIAFVLHGGDMVDAISEDAVQMARKVFALSVPVYLSLGNHDLTDPRAAEMWLQGAPEFFPSGGLSYSLEGAEWMLHVLPTQWCDRAYYWDAEQQAHFLPNHVADLVGRLVQRPEILHLICTHGEVAAVPAMQIGRSVPYHPPLASYAASVLDLVQQFPQLRGVLAGHNHINTHTILAEAHAITASAFTETPFEFKVFEISEGKLSMETVSLMSRVSFRADYDWDKTFVQGRFCDRSFSER